MARGLFSVSNLVEEKKGSVNIAVLFLRRLEEAIVKLEPEYKPSNMYKPSSLMCVRQMYFTRKGVTPEEDPKDASFIGICESGSDRHERVQKALLQMKDLGMEFEYMDIETYIKENNIPNIIVKNKKGMETHCINTLYNLSFMTDGIIKYQGKYYVFEYKTEVSMKWNNRDEHDLMHEAQGCSYALSFGIDDVLYVYENRDFCTKKCFFFKASKPKVQKLVIDKINTCEKFLEADIIPPKVTNIEIDENFKEKDYTGSSKAKPADKVCRYCPYKNECNKWL